MVPETTSTATVDHLRPDVNILLKIIFIVAEPSFFVLWRVGTRDIDKVYNVIYILISSIDTKSIIYLLLLSLCKPKISNHCILYGY